MKKSLLAGLAAAIILTFQGCASLFSGRTAPETDAFLRAEAVRNIGEFVQRCASSDCGFRIDPGSRVDSVFVSRANRTVEVHFNPAFAQIPFRERNVGQIRDQVASLLGPRFAGYTIDLRALDMSIGDLIPNAYRSAVTGQDGRRRPAEPPEPRVLVQNLDKPFTPVSGLRGRHIAIWPSHGWYYETRLDRWEWQRARLFQTVEDLLPMSFVVPYLAPMLERAGASVYMPRERDPQSNESLVDNDGAQSDSVAGYLEVAEAAYAWQTGSGPGFGMPRENLTNGVNPFRLGTYRYARSDTTNLVQAVWIPDIAETGDYAVYVAYASLPDATSDAFYTVHHLGGTTSFSVDQRMGGGTWIYLGTFRFLVGIHPETGQVTLTNRSRTPGKSVSADAVRFGGGMGNIVRGRSTSGRPRFTEGARYYMQYAGMPDRLVYNVTESLDDYVDDYRGRAEWVNYLKGAPSGPNKERQNPGMGIPIDLSLAFHTDAGVTKSDSTIGTLMIYSSEGADTLRVFPDGMSRFANRDLGDLMQTQIVSDIRALYDPAWSRRSIWDRDYSEAVRPNVPGVLLELLSHQNFADMKFALDPRFRFDVSRAIYKAMLRFIASQNDTDYVVAPLPVTHILAEFNGETSLRLRWRSRSDPIEPTADPTGFIVYTRRGSGAFDNGVYASSASYEMDHLEPGITYSFRVTAVNDGGESFPSEVVSAGWMHRVRSPVLVVNGFDRISAPGTIEEGSWRGFAGFVDEGVPDGYDASYVGEQYDYEMDSPWLDDDAPGHGASHSTFETRILAGNTFDFAAVHGEAIMSSGRSFVSASDEAVAGGMIELQEYDTLDLILGEEKTTFGPGASRPLAFRTFSIEMQEILRSYTDRGGRLFVSGAYVGTDLNGPWSREEDRLFSKDVLHLKWRTDHASLGGRIVAPNDVLLPYGSTIDYNTERTGSVYRVESPDAIEPVEEDGETLLRYADNLTSAAIGVRGTHRVVVFGFPFETITTARERALTMRAILNYLDSE